MHDLKAFIRDIPDFPKKGIIFKDITTLIGNGKKFQEAVDLLVDAVKDRKIDVVACIEARGFIFGSAVAYKIGAGIAPIRKKGKLPYKINQASYDLEYGKDTLEMHKDAFKKGANVLIVDDLLATGGTCRAVVDMIEAMGGKIQAIEFLVELLPLKGRDKLKDHNVISLIKDEYC